MIQVFLVEDHSVVRQGLRWMMEDDIDIHVVGEAENAQDALIALARVVPDVLILDISLPDRNGLELMRLVHEKAPNLACLIFSVYAEDIYAIRAMRQGAAGYLTKSSDAGAIKTAVKKVAGGGRYFTEAVMEKVAMMFFGHQSESHETLSDRELEVLKHVARGASLVDIADLLNISPSSVTTYRSRVLNKMGFKSNAELTRYAFEQGLIL